MNHTANQQPNLWRSKRLLVSGPNGFKGGWLTLEIAKGRVALVVNPKWHFGETVQRTWLGTAPISKALAHAISAKQKLHSTRLPNEPL